MTEPQDWSQPETTSGETPTGDPVPAQSAQPAQPANPPQPAQPTEPAELVLPSYDPTDGRVRRLHPLSPLVSSLPLIPAFLLASIFLNGAWLWNQDVADVPIAPGVIIVAFMAAFGVRYLQWRRYTYWFDSSGNLRIDEGLLQRNERKVQLSRLQAVDVEQPLLARMFGLAVVRIEIAGGADSKVSIEYLTLAEATEMRRVLLARSAGAEHDEPVASEDVILTVDTGELVISLLLRTVTFGLLLLTAVLVFFVFATQGAAGLALLPVTGGIPIFLVFSEFLSLYGFTVARGRDGVRLRRGLLTKTAQTVPFGRVAAVDIVEPLLWRRFGWVRIRLTVAGVSSAGDGDARASLATTTLVPIATHAVAQELLAQVLPGVDVASIPMTSAGSRARWRAPIQHGQLAYGANNLVFVTRRGFVTRHLSVVPHARTQSVSIKQGPYQRALGLSSLRVDIAPGPVAIEALYFPSETMRDVAQEQLDRARHARVDDWASAPQPNDSVEGQDD